MPSHKATGLDSGKIATQASSNSVPLTITSPVSYIQGLFKQIYSL